MSTPSSQLAGPKSVAAGVDLHRPSLCALKAGQAKGRRYAGFRFAGFLDWVAIRLTLISPTQARHLRAALPPSWAGGGEAPYVMPAAGERSHTDKVFTIRVQDPLSAARVERDVNRLAQRFPLASPPEVIGIELGIDASVEGADADLIDMAETFFRCLTSPASVNRRITGEKGTTGTARSGAETRRLNRAALAPGQSLVIGNQTDPVAHRVYIKEGTRARYEVTLQGDALPFRTLDEWAAFKFERLSSHFRWRLHCQPANGLMAVLQDRQVALAGFRAHSATHRRGRVHMVGTVADHELRDEALKALRRLTTAQRRDRTAKPKLPARASGMEVIPTKPARQVVDSKEINPSVLSTTIVKVYSSADAELTHAQPARPVFIPPRDTVASAHRAAFDASSVILNQSPPRTAQSVLRVRQVLSSRFLRVKHIRHHPRTRQLPSETFTSRCRTIIGRRDTTDHLNKSHTKEL